MNNRKARRALNKAQQQVHDDDGDVIFGSSVLAMPANASPFIRQLAPRILRTSYDGAGPGGDREHEDRAHAAFLVCLSHLANIKDDKSRENLIADLSRYADSTVTQIREEQDQIAEVADARGESVEEMMEDVFAAGVGEMVPDDEPTTH